MIIITLSIFLAIGVVGYVLTKKLALSCLNDVYEAEVWGGGDIK
jgi:hypothetical protein